MSESITGYVLGEDGGKFHGAHELQITVDAESTDPDLFREMCKNLGVTAHVIYNETLEGETVMTDYIAGLREHNITSAYSLRVLRRISTGLGLAGITVLREKIASTQNHPHAPETITETFKPNSYFESRFILPDIPTVRNEQALRWRGTPLYVSTSDDKRQQNLLVATMRQYGSTSKHFGDTINSCYSALWNQDIDVKYPTIGYVLYDSNPGHDKRWTNSYRGLHLAVNTALG